MSDIITIAVDAMGGDHGVKVTVPAALQVLAEFTDLKIILVGDQASIQTALANVQYDRSRIEIKHASEVVAMDEPPAQALRFKKDSSMRVMINLVHDGLAHACVSAGNTGALMATARFVLKTINGIDRPAISALLPTSTARGTRVLDLGANVDSTAEQLFQFAVMGSVLETAVNHVTNPKIALLNIGSEDIKGNEQVKAAVKLLEQNSELNYVGFIEGDQIFHGEVDVIVCDGFVGNVALKTSEGLAKFLAENIKEEFHRNFFTKLIGLIATPILKRFKKRFDPAQYNGASLVGLRGTVIKSHGSASSIAFANAIKQALVQAKSDVPSQISSQVERLLAKG